MVDERFAGGYACSMELVINNILLRKHFIQPCLFVSCFEATNDFLDTLLEYLDFYFLFYINYDEQENYYLHFDKNHNWQWLHLCANKVKYLFKFLSVV